MSMDYFRAKIGGKWEKINPRLIGGKWEYLPYDVWRDFDTGFWVDLSWSNPMIDERYYFPDSASAVAFYEGGWKAVQLFCDGAAVDLDHSGLYLNGQLIRGLSIYCDTPSHQSENLKGMLESLTNNLSEARKRQRSSRRVRINKRKRI